MTELEETKWHRIHRNPYVCYEAEAYVTAINILAIEFLVKTNDEESYLRWCNVLSKADLDDLAVLDVYLSVNHHVSSLGAMITQRDYEYQKETLFDFLSALENGEDI